ncbi:MAG: DUF86 domain-containing protein [Bacteroidetes bacterium]|nr:DUF86 domain-containing protein [Bacteroidota bacterium]
MIDLKLVEKKLRSIEDFLREIQNSPKINNFCEFENNVQFKRFIERNIELCIEKMIDVCRHIVSRLNLKEPESYGECFEMLTKEGIIAQDYLNTIQSMIKFRNLLIHAYDKIDDNITYGIYIKHLPDIKQFVDIIRKYANG